MTPPMPARTPGDEELERLRLFLASREFRQLYRRGLLTYGRSRRFTAEEWWAQNPGLRRTTTVLSYLREVERAAAGYGVNQLTALPALLLEGFDPVTWPFVATANWIRPRIATTQVDQEFIQALMFHARAAGLHVVQLIPDSEIALIAFPFPEPSTSALSRLPPIEDALAIRFEIPPTHSPKAVKVSVADAMSRAKRIAQSMGYTLSRRRPRGKPEGIHLPSKAVRLAGTVDIELMTESADAGFQNRLINHAAAVGLGTQDSLHIVLAPRSPLMDGDGPKKPPREAALVLRITVPIGTPVKDLNVFLAALLSKAREVLRRLGYRVEERHRRSGAVEIADKLRLHRTKLRRRETGDIAQDLYADQVVVSGRVMNRVKNSRYRAKKRAERYR